LNAQDFKKKYLYREDPEPITFNKKVEWFIYERYAEVKKQLENDKERFSSLATRSFASNLKIRIYYSEITLALNESILKYLK